MKKYLLLAVLVLSFLFIPLNVHAGSKYVFGKNYTTKNLKETLEDEQIDKEFSSYYETSDQVVIYMFRGNGCTYCRSFLSYLNSITNDYGKYFKLVSFEVWYDSDNAELFKKVSNYLDGEEAGGVPYIIIGDKVFPGYASSYDADIKNAIMNLYNTKIENRYDVFEKMEGKGSSSGSNDTKFDDSKDDLGNFKDETDSKSETSLNNSDTETIGATTKSCGSNALVIVLVVVLSISVLFNIVLLILWLTKK